MKTQIRETKKGVKRFLRGFFNTFVVLALIFQPVAINGSFGIPHLAIAEDGIEAPAAENDSASEEAEEGEQSEEETTQESSDVVNDDTENSEPAEETVTETSAEEAGESTDSEETTETEEGSIDEEAAATEATPVASEEEAAPDTEEAVADTTDTPEGEVCLNSSQLAQKTTESDWEVTNDGKKAVTKQNIELGVEYRFPGNEDVKVVFNCLPEDPAKRGALTIEQIAVADINLPEGVVAVAEYAYDITTDMENGTFKYDLELPKNASGDFDISYIEKSAEEVVDEELSNDDVKKIENKKIDNKEESVEATELDHFTVFVVTTTSGPVTFTITPDECTNDSAGVNDLNGQKDLTKMCRDQASSSTLNIAWDWDDTEWNGNNTGDSCSLFDTDGDGLANYALCVVVGGKPATYQSTRLYSCNDSRADRCAGDSQVNSFASACTASVLNNEDPFVGGSDYPKDTVASCAINLNDVGGAANTQLIDVCSFPSQQPNSDPSDCVVFKANSGKLEVKKALSPTTDAGLFNLQIDSVTQAPNATHNGTTGEKVVTVANHTFGETAGTATSLANYTASAECRAGNGTGAVVPVTGTGPWTVAVANEADIVCTITNTRVNNGSLTIVKDAVPNDAQDFSFTATGTGLSNFSLDDDGNNANDLSNTKIFSNLGAGTYAVSEGAVNGWTQTSATCSDGSPINSISLSAGENVTCTFTNTIQQASLTLVKEVVNNNIGTAFANAWTLSADGPTDISGATGTAGVTNAAVDNGTYTLSESGPTGYTASVWSCTNGVTVNGNSQITLAPGQSTTCTITNTRDTGTLQVLKNVDLNGDGDYTDQGETGATNWLWQANGGADHNTGDAALTVGTGDYALTETDQANFHQVGLSCQGGTLVANTVTVTKGANVICTFTNARDTGNLKAVKTVDDSTSLTQWSFALDGGTPIQANANGEVDFGQVTTGTTHTITESGPTGSYQLVSVTGTNCARQGATLTADATVAKNAATVCTFTNNVNKGSLTIIKDATPDDAQDFVFTATGNGVNGFTLDDDGDSQNGTSNTETFNGLFPGTYSVAETVAAGWDQTSATCTGDEDPANITLDPGQNVTCTFVNTKRGSITVEKQTEGGNGSFDFTGDASGTLADDGQITVTNLVPGQYSSTETPQAGWDLTSITCDDRDSSGNVQTGVATFTVAAGENVKCTFTNTKKGHLIVQKTTLPAGDQTEFVINASGNGTITGGGAGVVTDATDKDYEVTPGTYSVAETVPTGWDKTGDTCQGIVVAAGETKTCTITNTKRGTLTIKKDAINDNAQNFTFSTNFDTGATPGNQLSFLLDDDNNGTLPNNRTFTLPVGNYTVQEGTNLTWQLTGLTCSDQSPTDLANRQATITLDAGEVVECTFTNTQLGYIKGLKFNDQNTNGQWNLFQGEFGLGNWRIFIDQDDNSLYDSGEPTTLTSDFFLTRGAYLFTDGLLPGTYTVCEQMQAGWSNSTPLCQEVVITPGDLEVVNFGNFELGTIIVQKETLPDGSPQAFDFTASYDQDGFSLKDGENNNSGLLLPGEYSVSETLPAGWDQESVTCTSDQNRQASLNPTAIELDPGETVTCVFTNEQRGDIIVTKINDANGNGLVDQDEEALADWTMNLNDLTQVTGEDGSTTFSDLATGPYTLSEEVQEGWEQTNIICSGEQQPEPEPETPNNICHKTASSAHPWNAISVPVNNHVHQGHDEDFAYGGPVDKNGHPETGGVGEAWCAEHADDADNDQRQDQVNQLVAIDIDNDPFTETVNLDPGETITCQVLNTPVEPLLEISKSNNSFPTVETPGNTVEYTIEVTALENDVEDVKVTDLPPEGFEYVEGSATGATLSDPYASPGTWSLGNMTAGQTITLKYQAKISNSQDDGTYDDLAFAKGTSASGNTVRATDVSDADNFAGTLVAVATPPTDPTVNIDTDNRTETDTDKEYVLGASTGLPGTGANGKFLALAGLLLIGGLGLLFWDRRRAKLMVLAFAVLGSVTAAGQASAATSASGNVAIEIEQPEAVVGNPNFKIGFTALDIEGRALQVACKEASYGTFQTFELIPGGDSGDCQVNSAVMPNDGDYQFSVEVSTIGEEGSDSATEGPVNVKLISTHPGTPHNYERDQATCDDIITFTTADDGDKTVKVELYRSTEKDFTADEPVATAVIGSNQNGEFVVTPPDCQEDYWYALRAVDAYGNGSGFVGDEDVDVDIDTDTDTIILDGGTSGGGGAIPVGNTAAAAGAEGGAVEGAATDGTGDNGEVLGESDVNEQAMMKNAWQWVKDHPWFSSLSLIALIILALYGYRFYKTKYSA